MLQNFSKYLLIFLFCFSLNIKAQWHPLGPFMFSRVMDFSFFNDSTGLLFRNSFSPTGQKNILDKTSDFGINWSIQYIESSNGMSKDNQLFCFKKDTALFLNHFGGITDINISNNIGINWSFYSCCQTPIIETFHFMNPNYGITINQNGTLKRYYMSNSFTINPFPTSSTESSVWINSYSDAFVVVNKKDLYMSTDSGYTWSSILNKPYNLNQIYFSSANIGYIACDSGKVLKTINGGLNWAAFNTSYINNFHSVHFKNDTVGFIVGTNGICLKTANGGGSWIKEIVPSVNTIIKIVTLNKKSYCLDSDGKLFRRELDTCDNITKPSVSISLSTYTVCQGNGVAIYGSPSNGHYCTPAGSSGIYNTNYFDAYTSGLSNVGYFYTDPTTGCGNIAITTITVNPKPSVTLTASSNTVCFEFYGTATLTGTPPGGIYFPSGPNVTVGGQAIVNYSYSYTDTITGCNNKAYQTIDFEHFPIVNLSLSNNTTCTNATFGTTVTLIGSPSGGLYSGIGVTGNTFAPPSASGLYSVVYSYTDVLTSCASSDTTFIQVNDCVGIDEISAFEEILIYPNPFSEKININFDSFDFTKLIEIKIYNLSGSLVYNSKLISNKAEIDLSGFSVGIYLLKINTDNCSYSKKIFKN